MSRMQFILGRSQKRTMVRLMNGRKAVMVEPMKFLPITRNGMGDTIVSKRFV